MTIFVDALKPCIPKKNWRWNHSCHLFTDSHLMELHEFAESIGLERSWFQQGPLPYYIVRAHYDLTPGKRRQAISSGARVATRLDILRWLGRNTKPG